MLTNKKCKPCKGETHPMNKTEINNMLKKVDGWKYAKGKIVKTFTFKNYYQTTAFLNAAVWIAHQEDHHADIEFGYKTCRIRYSTHAIKGISKNDFICAAKIDALV